MTIVQFHLTAATLGPLFVSASAPANRGCWHRDGRDGRRQMVTLALRFFRLSASETVEFRASGTLLATTLARALDHARRPARARRDCASALRVAPGGAWLWPSSALAAEMLGRYLFFVSAVPKHMAAPYLGSEAA